MKHIILFITIMGTCLVIYGQRFRIQYTGSGSANVEGSSIYKYQISGGGNITSFKFSSALPQSENINNNSQSFTNRINSNATQTNYSISNDNYGNEIHEITVTDITSPLEFDCYYSGNIYTQINTSCMDDQFPVNTNSIPSDIQNYYLSATQNIQKNNSAISSKAQSLTANCTTMQRAITKIAEWVRDYVDYNKNVSQDALSVFNSGKGNCTGFTNLTIALLRSINIPTRFVGGAQYQTSFNVPFTNQTIQYSSVFGAHATHEIYFPNEGNWVRGDAQGSLFFTRNNFSKTYHAPDNDDVEYIASIVCDPPLPTITPDIPYNTGLLTNQQVNLNYVTHYSFGTDPSYPFYEAFRSCYPLGIGDEIEITSGPVSFRSGDYLQYTSLFTSGTGNTYPINFQWEIELHHDQGTYLYHSQDAQNPNFNITSTACLPDYNWTIDPLGNIYGIVRVIAELNDGTFEVDEKAISVEDGGIDVLANTNYTTNTTINCCYATINNCSVNSNKLTINTEKGVQISNNFSVASGAEFSIICP